MEPNKKKKTRRISLVHKILWPIFLIVIIFGFIASFGVYQQVYDLLLRFEKDNIKHFTHEQAHETELVIGNAQHLVQGLAENKKILDFFKEEDVSEEEILLLFEHYNLRNQFSSFYIMDLNGDVLFSNNEAFFGQNYSFRNYFKEAAKGKSTVDSLVGVSTGELGFYFAEPVIEKGNVLAVVVGKLRPESVYLSMIHETRNSITIPDTEFYLLDKNGVVIFSEDKDEMFKSVGPLTDEKKESFQKEKIYGNLELEAKQYEYVQEHIDNQEEFFQLEFFDQEDQEREVLTTIKLENFPFYIFTETYSDSIASPVKKVSLFIGLSVVFSVLMVIVFSYVYLNISIRPFKKLIVLVKNIANGNFDKRVDIKTNDEIGDLADSFNYLLDKILKEKQGVEEKIKLRTNELRKFQAAVESSTELVLFSDIEGIVLWANPALEKITGFTLEETKGTKAGRLWGKKMSLKWYEQLWKTIKEDKKIFIAEVSNHKKDGTEFISILTIYPILDEKGELELFVATQRDVTKEKEVDRLKTDFVSLASHQLRTPLSSMKWFLEMLEKGDLGKLNKEQKEVVSNIYQSNQRMIDLINSLLNINRVESGKIVVEGEEFDLPELVKGLMTDLKSDLKDKKQKVNFENKEKISKIKTDPKLLRQVLFNLLSNANRYSSEKTEIDLIASMDGKNLKMEVIDKGLGIPKKDQESIFSKFFRSSNAIEKDADGTGLGLYLSKTIIESLGGKISFESEEKKGSTFYFTLPLQ